MIRTTVRLDENLFKEARKLAIDKHLPFAEVVNEALAKHLGRPTKVKKNTGVEFLRKLVELGEKYPIKGAPKDLAKNHDKYTWG